MASEPLNCWFIPKQLAHVGTFRIESSQDSEVIFVSSFFNPWLPATSFLPKKRPTPRVVLVPSNIGAARC